MVDELNRALRSRDQNEQKGQPKPEQRIVKGPARNEDDPDESDRYR